MQMKFPLLKAKCQTDRLNSLKGTITGHVLLPLVPSQLQLVSTGSGCLFGENNIGESYYYMFFAILRSF